MLAIASFLRVSSKRDELCQQIRRLMRRLSRQTVDRLHLLFVYMNALDKIARRLIRVSRKFLTNKSFHECSSLMKVNTC